MCEHATISVRSHTVSSKLPGGMLVYTARLCAAVLLLGASGAAATVTLHQPLDGASFVADLVNPRTGEECTRPPCRASVPFEIEVVGANTDTVGIRCSGNTSIGTIDLGQPLCLPGDPHDPDGSNDCPIDATFTIDWELRLLEGTWTCFAQATRDLILEDSAPASFTVLPPGGVPTTSGTVGLSQVAPNEGEPRFVLRDPGPAHPNGIFTTPGEVEIIGQNLDTNPFLQVFLAPRPVAETPLSADSALPVDQWCRHPVEILSRGPLTGGDSKLVVRVPELPLSAPTRCDFGAPPGEGSIFAKDWRWVIKDSWDRPERVHEWWAIPSPRAVPWGNAPPFRIVKPEYPLVDGFNFLNNQSDASFKEFLTVYGNNAYLCAGVAGQCLTRILDPIYSTIWWLTYKLAIDGTGGSCNGLAATSLLMAREELQTEDFEPDVRFPFGFDLPSDPAVAVLDDRGNFDRWRGIPTYKDTNFCTPVCSPYKPDNLWATVRMNHGSQLSREFLREMLKGLGEAALDPEDLDALKGIPAATLERVAADPQGYVLCFTSPGNGHCVTPYRVDGSRIWVYDNNNPGDANRFIDIVDGEYDYPGRRVENRTPNSGHFLIAYPIDVWKSGRHLIGLNSLIAADELFYLFLLTTGDADMVVTNDEGGRWGWEDDGSFTNSLPGALSPSLLGPQEEELHQVPLLLGMDQPRPTVHVNADGGRYVFLAAAGGHLLQLESSAAQAGDDDQLQLGYEADGRLESFTFTPEGDATQVVSRVGLAIGEEESAAFQWLGLEILGGQSMGFEADKETRSTALRNGSGATSYHLLMLDYGSGPSGTAGRMVYGPFAVPDGASQRVILSGWPKVAEVTSELDLDGDGTPDHTEVALGQPGQTPSALSASADLSIEKTVAPDPVSFGGEVSYQVVVMNNGPDLATGVSLLDALPTPAIVSSVQSSTGSCSVSAAGVSCDLGDLPAGAVELVTYVAVAVLPGTWANGATVFGNEDDPDLTNNSAVATTEVPALVDITPGSDKNPIQLSRTGRVPVAILGSEAFDVTTIDRASLRFGPGAAAPVHRGLGHLLDVNEDGALDLLSHYRVEETELSETTFAACVQAMFEDGRTFQGCDRVTPVPGL
jgi:uncharacterized repeat protein (TIGR01451 family)